MCVLLLFVCVCWWCVLAFCILICSAAAMLMFAPPQPQSHPMTASAATASAAAAAAATGRHSYHPYHNYNPHTRHAYLTNNNRTSTSIQSPNSYYYYNNYHNPPTTTTTLNTQTGATAIQPNYSYYYTPSLPPLDSLVSSQTVNSHSDYVNSPFDYVNNANSSSSKKTVKSASHHRHQHRRRRQQPQQRRRCVSQRNVLGGIAAAQEPSFVQLTHDAQLPSYSALVTPAASVYASAAANTMSLSSAFYNAQVDLTQSDDFTHDLAKETSTNAALVHYIKSSDSKDIVALWRQCDDYPIVFMYSPCLNVILANMPLERDGGMVVDVFLLKGGSVFVVQRHRLSFYAKVGDSRVAWTFQSVHPIIGAALFAQTSPSSMSSSMSTSNSSSSSSSSSSSMSMTDNVIMVVNSQLDAMFVSLPMCKLAYKVIAEHWLVLTPPLVSESLVYHHAQQTPAASSSSSTSSSSSYESNSAKTSSSSSSSSSSSESNRDLGVFKLVKCESQGANRIAYVARNYVVISDLAFDEEQRTVTFNRVYTMDLSQCGLMLDDFVFTSPETFVISAHHPHQMNRGVLLRNDVTFSQAATQCHLCSRGAVSPHIHSMSYAPVPLDHAFHCLGLVETEMPTGVSKLLSTSSSSSNGTRESSSSSSNSNFNSNSNSNSNNTSALSTSLSESTSLSVMALSASLIHQVTPTNRTDFFWCSQSRGVWYDCFTTTGSCVYVLGRTMERNMYFCEVRDAATGSLHCILPDFPISGFGATGTKPYAALRARVFAHSFNELVALQADKQKQKSMI
jgi:hypothetical protein